MWRFQKEEAEHRSQRQAARSSKGKTSGKSKGHKGSRPPCLVCGQTDHAAGECPQRTHRMNTGKGRSHGSVGYAAFTGWANSVCLVGLSAESDLNLSRSMTAFAPCSMGEFLGYGIWVTGATGTMAGLDGMQELLHFYKKMHVRASDIIVDTSRNTTLTFANGEKNESVSTCVFPRYFEGPGDQIDSLGLSFAVLDKSRPILLGTDVASSMDVIIDTTQGTVYSRLLGRFGLMTDR